VSDNSDLSSPIIAELDDEHQTAQQVLAAWRAAVAEVNNPAHAEWLMRQSVMDAYQLLSSAGRLIRGTLLDANGTSNKSARGVLRRTNKGPEFEFQVDPQSSFAEEYPGENKLETANLVRYFQMQFKPFIPDDLAIFIWSLIINCLPENPHALPCLLTKPAANEIEIGLAPRDDVNDRLTNL